MSTLIFLVVLSLASEFSKSNLITFNFRQTDTEKALAKLPREDQGYQYEMYINYTNFSVENDIDEEMEAKTDKYSWDDAKTFSINLQVWQVAVDAETDPFGFFKVKKGFTQYRDTSMKELCEKINESLKGWKVNNDYVFSLTMEKLDRLLYKIVIETFSLKTIGEMYEKTDVNTYEFRDLDRLVLL